MPLQLRQNASVVAQGCADFSSDSTDRNHSFTPDPWRASPSLRSGLSFRYTQAESAVSSENPLKSLWIRADFDSTIRRFESSRTGQRLANEIRRFLNFWAFYSDGRPPPGIFPAATREEKAASHRLCES